MAEEKKKDPEEVARQRVKASATDHIMSFVHTKHQIAVPKEERGKRLLTTEFDREVNQKKAQALADQVVTPTSSNMTVGYYLKGYHARAADPAGKAVVGTPGALLRAPGWIPKLLTVDEAANRLVEYREADSAAKEEPPRESSDESKQMLGAVRGNFEAYQATLIRQPVPFDGEERKGIYRLENRNEVNETNAQSVWIPGIENKLQLPQRVKKADTSKKLENKLRELASVVKPLKDVKRGDELKPNPLTPLAEYYLMRYMAPWLVSQGYIQTALPFKITDKRGSRVVLRRIEVDRTQTNQEFDDGISRLIQELVAESETPIDEMFSFERIRTTYDYPANYPEGFTDEHGYISQPDPKQDDIAVNFGLLQQLYAAMTPANRKSFIKQTKKWVLDTMPKLRVRRHQPGDRISPSVSGGRQNYYYPTGADQNLSYAEAVLVWLEETRDERAFQNEYSLKLPTNLDKPNDKEQISEGATIVVPGIVLLLAEKRNDHSLYDSISTAETTHVDRIDDENGYDYLQKLMEITQRPGLIKDGDPEGTVDLQTTALQQILSSEYEGLYQPINQNTARFIHRDGDIISTISVNPATLAKAVKESEVASKLKDMAELDYAKAFMSDILYNTEVQDKDDNRETAAVAYALETGLQMRKARKFGAKAFNALGYLVEDQMIRSGQQASRTTQVSRSSDFDKMVAALIGSAKYPGLAVSHAALHYQKLYVQMRSPIGNWNMVEKDEFEEGQFLSLTSFLENPTEKALYWMLNETGFVTVGDFTGDRPTFFETPKSKAFSDAAMTGLQNSFATVVIGYYRLLFSQIRQRMVFARSGQEGAKAAPEMVDLNKYWKNLMRDASSSPPDAGMFGAVLRFFSQSEIGVKPILQIPTWMPVMPADIREAKQVRTDKRMTLNYLKWAYGTDPVSLENFGEVAAAYHAAKALSDFDDYPHMVERFVSAVVEDRGAPFLFAILYSSDFNQSPETVQGQPVSVVNFMPARRESPARAQESEGEEGAEESKSDESEGNADAIREEIERIRKGGADPEAEAAGSRLAILSNINIVLDGLVQALRNPDSEGGIAAAFDVAAGYAITLPEGPMREQYSQYIARFREDANSLGADFVANQIEDYPFTFEARDMEESND